jgi:3-oxoacyl-[acyl-carrier protein] reductase
MTTTLHDRVILVTGASQGIGLGIARLLAERGARLALIARQEQRVAEVAESIGGGAHGYGCPVQDPERVQRTVQRVLEDLGAIHGLVNNAGITRDGLLLRMSQEDWDEVVAVNLTGTFNFTRAVTKSMIRQKFGRIVNVTSVIGQMGNAGQVNYAASKAGIIGLTKAVARELASRNITVNAVAPGYIATAMTADLPDSVRDDLMKSIPLQRMGTPEDVARTVAFLLSEEASYITGQVLNCDGGMWMHS